MRRTRREQPTDQEDRLTASILLSKFARLSPKHGRQLNILLTRILKRADEEIRSLKDELAVCQEHLRNFHEKDS